MDATLDPPPSFARPRALISRTALLHNVKVIRRHLRPETRICAVIKADAYGHGARIVADTLTNFSSGPLEGPAVDALAVATFEEAAALGAQDAPLYVLRPVESVSLSQQREEIETAIREGWTLTLCSPSAAGDIARLATSMGRRASVQIMIDTGMAREGGAPQTVSFLASAIAALPALRLAALCTHYVNAEEPASALTEEQTQAFEAATGALVKAVRGGTPALRHAANSAACFFAPDSQFDMVRPGVALFGIDPTGRPSVDRALRPALRCLAPLLLVRNVRAGQCVGYAQSWKAPRDTRIGLVPLGYADGYFRAFSNRAMVMVHGRPAPVVGRVSMDYLTVDLSAVPQAAPGDDVTLVDGDPLSPASVYRLADLAQTIPYEIVVRLGPRIQRIAIEPDEIEAEPTVPNPAVTVQHRPLRLTPRVGM